ncbi:MAG TPA: PAS domain S-box protein [Capsulimonadaceae bacterium]|nr:PAS domain S-box protein [Capsulimonadaceae bacterium]
MTTIAERYAYFKRLITQAIATPVILLVLLAILLVWQVEQLLSSAHWVDHTDQVIAQAYRAQRIALQAQTGLRGYLIARDPRYLDPFNQAQKEIGPAFGTLQDSVIDNPQQVDGLHRLQDSYKDWLAAANLQIAQRNRGPSYFQQLFLRSRGQSKMDVVLNRFNQFVDVEARLREERVAKMERTTDGILASSAFFALAAGLVLGLLSARRLQTVSHEYEQALSTAQKSGQMLATTLLSIGDAVLVTDQHGRITQMNAIAEEITGWSSAEAVGQDVKNVFRILNEATGEPAESPIDRVLSEGVIVGLANHTVLVRADGKHVPIDDSGAPIHDEQGRLVGVVLVFRDIAERRRADEAKYHLASIVESSDDAIISKDLNGIITSWNTGAERLFGYTAEEVIGQPILIIYPPDRHGEMPQILERIKRGERIEQYETVRRAKDGRLIDVSLSVSPLLDAAGKIIGASKIARDITERKRYEQRLATEFEKQHRIAETLQESLLAKPTLGAFPQLESETFYRPARQEAKVGGDYYDLFRLEDNKVVLVVGDVSGKGLNAAAKTAELKFTLRAFLHEHAHPATGATRLNAFMCESPTLEGDPQPYFLCLTVVVLDMQTRKAEICVGGAEPPIVIRAAGQVELADVMGMPLGVDPKAEYKGTVIQLSPKDVLLIATDGVTEARRGKDFLGIDGLIRLARDCGSESSLQEIGNCLVSKAEEFTESGFSDDVCLLLARTK